MKRRKILRLFGMLPVMPLFLGCKDPKFENATNIFGRVIDQDGKPLEGFEFRLLGYENGLGGRTTFVMDTADNIGEFKFSQVIPKSTDSVLLLFYGSDSVIIPDTGSGKTPNYTGYYVIDGTYQPTISPVLRIPENKWGQTTEFHFKYEKI